MVDDSLKKLSDAEHVLYEEVISRLGEDALGKVTDKYKNLHIQYLELYDDSSDPEVRLEALKRLIFLHWQSILEPIYLTGIGELDTKAVARAYQLLNDLIGSKGIDKEFKWMLSFYSSWDYLLFMSIDPQLRSLVNFISSVDPSKPQLPKQQLPKGSMDNRGQMGIYWQSCSVEVEGL